MQYFVRILRIILLLIAGGLLFLLLWFAVVYRDVINLRSELGDFLPQMVQIDGVQYDFVEGRVKTNEKTVSVVTERQVLRFMQFVTATRINPILGLSATDLDAFNESIDELKLSEQLLVDSYTDTDDVQLLKNGFYPIRFLERLQSTESARRQLLTELSEENAQAYHDSLLQTLEEARTYIAYVHDLYAGGFSSEVGVDTVFAFTSGTTSIAYMGSYLDDAYKHIVQRSYDEVVRWDCRMGKQHECGSLAFPQPMVLRELEEIDSALPEDVSTHLSILSTHYGKEEARTRIDAAAPVFVLKESRCFAGEGKVYYAPRWVTTTMGEAFYITYLNDIHVHDLSRDTKNSFYDALKDRGVRYLYQPLTNHYMCPDIGLDTAWVLTAYRLHESLKQDPLLSDQEEAILTALGAGEVRDFEKLLVTADVLSRGQIDTYVRALQSILATHSERFIAEQLGEENLERVIYLTQMYREQSVDFDALVRNAVRTNSVVGPVRAYGATMPVPVLFVTRSFIPELMQFNNESFIQNIPPILASPHFIREHPTLVSYHDLLSTEMTPEAFLIDIGTGRAVDYALRAEKQ